jgi:lipopolysaccharide export LptBFGC system permease protein LptF
VSLKSNTYCILLLCVCVGLVIQNSKRMFLVIICGMSFSVIFFTLSDTRQAFQERFIEYNIYV